MTVPRLISYLLFAAALAGYPLFSGLIRGTMVPLGAWLGGILAWTLSEYLVHRFLFHRWGGKKAIWLAPRLLAMHGRHHHLPEEMEVGLLPIHQGPPLLLTLGAVLYLGVGEYAFLILSGFVAGYIGYMVLHYTIHRGPPPLAWLRPLWKQHSLHHSRYPNKCFGVTTIFWDRLFGTLPAKGPRERKLDVGQPVR